MSRLRGVLLPVALCLVLAAPVLAASPVAGAAPRRGMVLDFFEVGTSDRFVVKGRVKQSYRRGTIVVQQRLNRGRWTAYTRARATASGRFRLRVAPRGATGDVVCYRLVLPAGKGFQRTVVGRASRGRSAGGRLCIETLFG